MDCCRRAVAVASERCLALHCQRRRCYQLAAHEVQLALLLQVQLALVAQQEEMEQMQLAQPEEPERKAWQIVESCPALIVPRQLESHQRLGRSVLLQPSLPPPS